VVHRIEVVWTCKRCEVGGQDVQEDGEAEPACWNCGGPVVVTARPTVPLVSEPDAA
jgi:DNA-directed RNA polymerase subunit RPC12/RpoP